MVQYLVSRLESEYELSISNNGREGIEMALEQIPDIIISDVMMPEKDGYELCDTLKKDERTSHIPIVLLTAKAGPEPRIASLEQGADAYLTKPFEHKELMIRLQKLHELKKNLQARYQSLEFADAKGVSTPSKEDAFLLKLKQIIEDNLADDRLRVSHLAHKLQLSESQVYRKVKALTDKSPPY